MKFENFLEKKTSKEEKKKNLNGKKNINQEQLNYRFMRMKMKKMSQKKLLRKKKKMKIPKKTMIKIMVFIKKLVIYNKDFLGDKITKKRNFGKNPAIDTTFLPVNSLCFKNNSIMFYQDKDREDKQKELEKEFLQNFEKEQKQTKSIN